MHTDEGPGLLGMGTGAGAASGTCDGAGTWGVAQICPGEVRAGAGGGRATVLVEGSVRARAVRGRVAGRCEACCEMMTRAQQS